MRSVNRVFPEGEGFELLTELEDSQKKNGNDGKAVLRSKMFARWN